MSQSIQFLQLLGKALKSEQGQEDVKGILDDLGETSVFALNFLAQDSKHLAPFTENLAIIIAAQVEALEAHNMTKDQAIQLTAAILTRS